MNLKEIMIGVKRGIWGIDEIIISALAVLKERKKGRTDGWTEVR